MAEERPDTSETESTLATTKDEVGAVSDKIALAEKEEPHRAASLRAVAFVRGDSDLMNDSTEVTGRHDDSEDQRGSKDNDPDGQQPMEAPFVVEREIVPGRTRTLGIICLAICVLGSCIHL